MDPCIECKKVNCLILDECEGNIVCTECGRVNTMKIIDDTAEWRNFEDDGGVDPRRVGMPNNDLLGDKGLGTTISDTYLKRWGQRSQYSNVDSALLKTFIEIEHICNSLSLSAKASEYSKKLFKTVYSTKQTKGKSHMGLVCACVFITCRKLKSPCNLLEIARECSVDKNKLIKAFEFVNQHSKKVFPLSKAERLGSEYAGQFKMIEQDIEGVIRIIEDVSEFRKNKGSDQVSAILAVMLIEALQGRVRKLEEYCWVAGIQKEDLVEAYREVFKCKSILLRGFGTSWEIANLPNY